MARTTSAASKKGGVDLKANEMCGVFFGPTRGGYT